MAEPAHDLTALGSVHARWVVPAAPPAPRTALAPPPEPIAIEQEPVEHRPMDRPRPAAITLRPGCYRLTVRPFTGVAILRGALRIDEVDAGTTVAGELYRHPRAVRTLPRPWLATTDAAYELPSARLSTLRPIRPLGVPEHRPDRFHSALRATAVRTSPLVDGRGEVVIEAEEYRYAPPAAAGFAGTFAAEPRVVTLVLEPRRHAPGYTALYLEGTLYEDRVPAAAVALGWVAPPL